MDDVCMGLENDTRYTPGKDIAKAAAGSVLFISGTAAGAGSPFWLLEKRTPQTTEKVELSCTVGDKDYSIAVDKDHIYEAGTLGLMTTGVLLGAYGWGMAKNAIKSLRANYF